MPELDDAMRGLRHLVHGCALDVVEGRVTPDEGAALLEFVRNELVKLGFLLDGFVGLEAEYEMAGVVGAVGSQRSESQKQIEREIMSRAETLRRTLERTS